MAELKTLKTDEYHKALGRLNESLAEMAHSPHPIQTRDSALMRFIFCAELAAKTAKLLLREQKIEAPYPKAIYRELQKIGLLSPEKTETALKMIDDRNRIAHDYSEEFAEQLFDRIQNEYAPLFDELSNVYSNEQS